MTYKINNGKTNTLQVTIITGLGNASKYKSILPTYGKKNLNEGGELTSNTSLTQQTVVCSSIHSECNLLLF